MATFPWKRGKKAVVFDDLTAEMDKRYGPTGTKRKGTVQTTPSVPIKKHNPYNDHRNYGGELQKEYWKRGVKKL